MKKINLQKFPLIYFLIFVLLIVSTIIFSIYYFNIYDKKHKEEINKQLTAITELKVNEIVQWRNERINDAKLFYNNKRIQSLIQNFLTDTNDIQTIDYIEKMFDYVFLNNEYCKIIITDSVGNQLLTYPKNKKSNKSDQKQDISKVKYSGNIYFKDMTKDYTNDSIHLEIVVPVFNNEKHLIAAIELCINPNKYLFPLIKFWPTESKTGETFIVRRENDSVVFINNLKFKNNSALNFRISTNKKNSPSVMAVRGDEGIVNGINYNGENVIACVLPIKGTPWFLVSQINTNEAFESMNERRWEVILSILIIIVSFTFIFFFLWRRQQYALQKQNYQSVIALLESEKKYKTIFEGAGEGIIYHSINGKILECNNAFAKMHGYTQKDIVGITLQEINIPESAKKIEQRVNEILNNGKHIFEVEHIHKSGKIINIEATSTLFTIKGEKVIVSFQRDITNRKISENSILKLNRIYALISSINKTIVRVKNINELYNKACKTAIEFGKFKMAWIGELNQNTNKVEVISFAGIAGNYLENLDIDLNNENRSNGPTAKAIKTGFYSYSNNIQEDLAMLPWINEAIKLGYKSSIALPLIVFEKTIGTLNLYSGEKDFFDQQEINLLIEVSNDISFAIEILNNNIIHKETENKLITSEEKFRMLAENSSDIIWTLDIKTLKFTYRSPSFEKVLGYTLDDMSDLTFDKYFTPETYKFLINEINESIKQLSEKKIKPDEVKVYEVKEYCKNGTLIDVEIRAKFLFDNNNIPVGIQGVTTDISKRKKAEQQLVDSEKQLSESQKIARLGSYSLNTKTGTWTSSNILDEIFGIDINYARNINSWIDIIFEEDKQMMSNYIENEVIGKQNNFNKEYRIKRINDNEIRWVHGLGELKLDENGNPITMFGTITDITERKKAEEDIRVLNYQRKLILDCAGEGIFGLDINGNHTFINPKAAEILGYKIEELIGKNSHSTWHHSYEDGTPIPESKCQIYKTLKDGTTNFGEEFIWRKDGTGFYASFTCMPKYEKEKIIGSVVTIMDITERKKAEKELIESKELFKTLTTVTQVGIFQTTPDGTTNYVNPKWTELAGLTLDEAKGNGWLNAVHPEDREKLQENWLIDNKSKNISIAEYRFLRKDNTIVWVLGNAIPYFKDKKLLGYIGAVTDITQQKQIENEINNLNLNLEKHVNERTEQLQAANNELEAFSYSISHDLKTPLRVIKGFSKMLQQKYNESIDDEGIRILKVMTENTENMESLISSLLYLSRTTYTEMRKINVDMNILMNIVINESLTPEIKNDYKITIGKLPSSNADAELIKQVWINLISNAIKYTQPKKEKIIEIGGWEETNKNIYYVKDNGVGFNSEYSSKLFKAFQRLHKSEDFEGTGVGLAIVSRIINKHGGSVWAEGKLNEGATFWFSLPK